MTWVPRRRCRLTTGGATCGAQCAVGDIPTCAETATRTSRATARGTARPCDDGRRQVPPARAGGLGTVRVRKYHGQRWRDPLPKSVPVGDCLSLFCPRRRGRRHQFLPVRHRTRRAFFSMGCSMRHGTDLAARCVSVGRGWSVGVGSGRPPTSRWVQNFKFSDVDFGILHLASVVGLRKNECLLLHSRCIGNGEASPPAKSGRDQRKKNVIISLMSSRCAVDCFSLFMTSIMVVLAHHPFLLCIHPIDQPEDLIIMPTWVS